MIVGTGVALLAGDDATNEPTSSTAPASPTADLARGGPCPYTPIDKKYTRADFENPPEERSRKKLLDTTVTTKFTKRSRVKLGGCGLKVRSYNGNLFGSTLRVKPGDKLKLKLRNRLPKQSPAEIEEQFEQQASKAHIVHTPVPYNTTNVHYHGLHVSPRDASDNVLLEIGPGDTFQYELDLPEDHPPGTYWYHAHAHGSTAIQVASGMAGALIVEDDPKDIPGALRAANEREKVMLFQSILYDTDGQVEQISALFPSAGPGEHDPNCAAGKPTCTWKDSHRRTTINGRIAPTIHMRPGEVQRWRMIDATYNETLTLELEDHDLNEIALDGNYLGTVDTWPAGTPIVLEPGYRSDVLVKASEEEGTYRLLDRATSAEESLRGVPERGRVLAHVVVSGEPMDMRLPNDDEMAPLAPFPDLVDIAERATGVETVLFKIGFDPAGRKAYLNVNYAAFSNDNVRTVFLNHVDEWRIGTVGTDDGFPSPTPSPTGSPSPGPVPPVPGLGKHIFHIHVNPFQVAREDPDGNQELVWKDTLAVNGPPVSVYTKYTDFTGKFVLHCHILDHEDLGMMQIVNVVKESSIDPKRSHHRGGRTH